MTILDVDDIATDADLALELGGTERLNSTQKSESIRDAFRASALVDVLAQLSTRSPPIVAGDLSDPTELKSAVVYRALYKICFGALTGSSEDRNEKLSKQYADSYQDAVRASFSVSDGPQSGPSGWSFSFERR